MFWYSALKFIVAFIAISSLLLLVSGIISSVVNPQIVLNEEGQAIEKGRNSRMWLGLITSIFWSLFFVL